VEVVGGIPHLCPVKKRSDGFLRVCLSLASDLVDSYDAVTFTAELIDTAIVSTSTKLFASYRTKRPQADPTTNNPTDEHNSKHVPIAMPRYPGNGNYKILSVT
jgi:hypothetical protein